MTLAEAAVAGNLRADFLFGERLEQVGADFGNCLLRVLEAVFGDNDLGHRVARDCVVLRAAAHIDQTERKLAQESGQKLTHHLVGVGSAAVDFLTAVTADQAVHIDVDALPFRLGGDDRECQAGGGAAGAAHRQDPLLLGVAVDQDLALEHGGVEGRGAEHADLLVNGEHALKGRMRKPVGFQNRQRIGDGNPVVSAEGGSLRPDITAVGP